MAKKTDRIVFPDAGSVDYGDLGLESLLKGLGNIDLYRKTARSLLLRRLEGADMVITNKCPINRALMAKLPDLRAVHVAATGVNNVDLEAARECGVAVTNAAGYSTESVVQFTFGFILSLAGNLPGYFDSVRRGDWCHSDFFVLPRYPVSEIAGKTLSLMGYGTIGKRVARVAQAFGMKVLVARIPGRRYPAAESRRRVSLAQAVKKADFLSIHVPLTTLTENLIGRELLRTMKRSAFIINMARGGIVTEADLELALRKHWIAGAASDVLTREPPQTNHILLRAPGMLLTPHVAWASREARGRLIREIVLNIRAFQQGRRRNRVI